MARLFTAIELPLDARLRVAAEQRRLASLLTTSSIRWVPRDQLHVTLVFLGDVHDEGVGQVLASLEAPFALAPFRLDVRGSGVFPARGRPRALWLGFDRGRDELTALRALVAGRISSAGLPVEARPYAPHLTVGRFRDGSPVDRSRLHERSGAQVLATHDVREVVLFESRLSSAGASHSVRLRTRLAGPALH